MNATATATAVRTGNAQDARTVQRGDILIVRGWEGGQELTARRAVVVAEAGVHGDRAVIWFYADGRGPVIGETLQPLYLDSRFTVLGKNARTAIDSARLARWAEVMEPRGWYSTDFAIYARAILRSRG